MAKYDKEKILQSIQFAYIVAGFVILVLCLLVFSTAWFSYELRMENELLRDELKKTEQVEDDETVQVRSIEGPERGYQRSYRRFDDASKRPFGRRNA